MAKKKKIERPSEIPLPHNPEIVPESIPEPILPEEEPEITPEKDPDEPLQPPEVPQKNRNLRHIA